MALQFERIWSHIILDVSQYRIENDVIVECIEKSVGWTGLSFPASPYGLRN